MKSYLLTVSLSLSETTRLRHVNPLVTRLRPARTTPGRCPQVVRRSSALASLLGACS